jgi:hypothetical protein
MDVDMLKSVDTKGVGMFRKKQVSAVCDNLCRAAKLRDEALFKVALQGPRI